MTTRSMKRQQKAEPSPKSKKSKNNSTKLPDTLKRSRNLKERAKNSNRTNGDHANGKRAKNDTRKKNGEDTPDKILTDSSDENDSEGNENKSRDKENKS